MMKTLDTLELPLNRTALIEASAGTGKTFTMANLYLRLLLGVGSTPLTVEQILVVTFTKAATEELRDRIRRNIKACRTFFHQAQTDDTVEAQQPFYLALFKQVENVGEAMLRLKIAEREIDLASIFTIHSFCQKMLFQFAFDSGMRFDSDLQPDESELLQRLSEEVWREQFYPMNQAEATVVARELRSPAHALSFVYPLLAGELPELDAAQKVLFEQDLHTFLQRHQQFLADAKQHWRENQAAILAPIQTELAKKYKTGEKKSLSRSSYKSNLVPKWIDEVDAWANSDADDFPKNFARFCQSTLREKAETGAEPLDSPLFAKNEAFLTAYYAQFAGKSKSLLLFHFLKALRHKLADYKATHSEKSFNDMLSLLNQALKGDRGDALAEQIRHQFPFAMIDEFQDTDTEQYAIFHKLFMSGSPSAQGFIMIGDPKQSIYKFRGADIFTYLKAAEQAQEKRTLPKNWRSLPQVVEATNALFQFPDTATASPFLYQGIQFQPVEAKSADAELIGEAHMTCFLQAEFDEAQAAEQCAYQIQQQLKRMQAVEFGLKFANSIQPFAAKDISVLVRSKKQASLMKNALAARGIRSVFLSEDRSVFEGETACELLWILYACLNPSHPRTLLTALGSGLWGLSAQAIFQLKNDEQKWDEQVNRFIHYQHLWQQHGVLPMLHQLFMQEGVIERLLANPNERERRLTDLLHVTELLQNAMASLENESALVRWYERQLATPRKQDDQVLRLESEEALIKIITIHGSKGLQYPIVWLPFVGKSNDGARTSALAIYHDAQERLRWQLGSADENVRALLNQAEFAEELRLLYVAMTRAEAQMNLILPQKFEGWNAVHYLLSNGELDAETDCATYFKRKGIQAALYELPDSTPEDNWRPALPSSETLVARQFMGTLRQDGQITSFSALHAQHEWSTQHPFVELPLREVVQDDDRQAQMDEAYAERENATLDFAYQFPHSAKVGNVLHRFFEQCDFQQAVEFEQIFAICQQLGLEETWVTPTQQWLEQVLATPFGDEPFSLKAIAKAKRLNEWQFYLRLKNEHALKQLNGLLVKHLPLSKNLPALQLPQLEGFVRGFVDCIAEVNGKFYVLDYKSNFLGYLPDDYRPQNLIKTMGQYRYDLQYVLYSLALHRYLRVRLGAHYDYARHFGGVAYLFLRGMNGTPNSGVFFDKPSQVLLDGMDELFG